MGALSDRFNLEKQLVFYLSYHDDKVNQWIHFMCIWPILISALTMFADTEPLTPQPAFLSSGAVPYGQYMVLNYSAVVAAVYMTWYILLDPLAGSLGAALVFCAYLFANFMSAMAPQSYGVPGWQLALPVHLIAWTLQFIGHGVFERRKPALLDSLDQALITAPMFVLLEALFPMGYRPELFKKVEKQAKINVKIFREQGTKAKAY